MVLIFYSIVALMLLVSILISGKLSMGLFIGGCVFGFFMEIFFEFCWNYNVCLKPYVWRDVPLVVILGWGAICQFGLSISDLISTLLKVRSKTTRFTIDVSIMYIILFLNEVIMSLLNYWTYNNELHPQFMARFIGFVFLGSILTSVSRTINNLIIV